MRPFSCDQCGSTVYFDNQRCLACGCRLAFLPDQFRVGSIEPSGDVWLGKAQQGNASVYKLCTNDQLHGVCNWAINANDVSEYCVSCRMTSLIPPLASPQGHERWRRTEGAKRRLLFNLRTLGLPLFDGETHQPLRFAFAEPLAGGSLIMTGHERGLITLNISEADVAYRVSTRESLSERYRTLLGHLRHEVGHYYWDELVMINPDRLEAFRMLFGDERTDYAAALQSHYQGQRMDWQPSHISAYASSHPWEDWAESWAHYMHIRAAVETADTLASSLNPVAEEALRAPEPASEDLPAADVDFDALMKRWEGLSTALNELNRSLGQDDAYPFSMTAVVRDKVRFIHDTIRDSRICQ